MKRLLPTLLILSAFSLPMAQGQSANDYNERATTLAQKGDYAGALKNYDAAIKAAPTEYAAYLNRAQLYKVLKKTELAMADLNRAVKISGNDPEVVYERAKLYYDQKKYPLALADVNRSIQSDPNVADRYATRAAIYQGMKLYNKAITDCTKFLSTNPRAGQIYDARGSAFLGLNQLDKAVADYSAAIACNGKDGFALAMRGSIYQKQKKYDLALADLTRVIGQVPDSPSKAQYYKERLKLYELLHEKRQDVIAGDIERIATLEPKNVPIRYQFAEMAWRQQPQLAIRFLTEGVALEPTNVKFLALLGRVQAETGQNKSALENLNKAIAIDANNADSYTARAQSYLGDYKYAEALADADKAIAIAPNAVEVFYFKGSALEGLRNSKGAVEAYERFARLKAQAPNRTNEDDRRIEQAKRKVELLTKNLSESEKAALNVPEVAPPKSTPTAPPAPPENAPTPAPPAK